jgi:putative SOS response-associated peptidase YedK
MYFAALWEVYPVTGHDYLSVALITQEAATLRRPLILDEHERALWLSDDTTPEQLAALLAKPQVALRERALATLVNDPKLDAPECLTPA